ncbi:MAG: T9SS type A sorting domain-containing protein [Marinilabiliales bacterium]|nr:T9SS type A sorting domain-containing protein [Marinilabiliales bacterium]
MTTGANQDVQQQLSELLIYPNPGTDIVTIEFCPPSAGDATTNIYDYTGRLIAQNQSFFGGSPQALKNFRYRKRNLFG